MSGKFQGKVVIVTGGATGIGRATAAAFAQEGAKVVIATGSNVAGGEAAAEAIRAAGGEATFVQCDVSNEAQVENLVAKTVERYGRLDIAFNNAGVGPDGVRMPFSALADTDTALWDKTMAVNARGTFLCLKHEIRQMLKQGGGGAIVNTASVGGLRMAPNFGAYGPSKAAVIAVSRVAALEYGKDGIRVNVVCPGPTLGTELMKNSMATGGDAAPEGEGGPGPMHKMGQTSDISNAVLFLASEDAGHITGHALSVDGGMADVG